MREVPCGDAGNAYLKLKRLFLKSISFVQQTQNGHSGPFQGAQVGKEWPTYE